MAEAMRTSTINNINVYIMEDRPAKRQKIVQRRSPPRPSMVYLIDKLAIAGAAARTTSRGGLEISLLILFQ